MAETQRSPESVRSAKRLRASMDPPGLRRLRFPFFDPLVKERSGRSDHDAGPACAAPSRGKRDLSPGRPREASYSIRRLPAHCRAPVHGARSAVINLNRHPCQQLGEEFLRRVRRSTAALVACRKTARIATQHEPAGTLATALIARGATGGRTRFAAHGARSDARPQLSRAWSSAMSPGGRVGGTTRGMDTRRHAPLGRRRVHLRLAPARTAVRMPISAAPAARSATSTSATMPTRARAAASAGC